jgi:integrase
MRGGIGKAWGYRVLTEVAVKAAKPREKPYKLADARGLYLLVSQTGARLWRLKYRQDGVERLLSLGAYPDVSLKRAREKRDEARRKLGDGIDPRQTRVAADTFAAVAKEWLGKQSALAASTVRRDRDRLENFVFPYLGRRIMRTITPADLLHVLRRIEARGTHETAHRTRAVVGRIFRYGIATSRADRDITADIRGALTPSRATNYAAITEPRRIGELMRAIDGYVGQPQVETALRIAPYVFARPGELRGARWAELDLDAAEWRIPAARMKGKREHIVPLASQVVALLRALEPITGGGPLVFPSLRASSRPISEVTLNAALRRMGFSKDEMTPHGFRSMASTRLNEMGYPPSDIELQLAHRDKDEVRAAYNRSLRLDERRKMMQFWADYLDGLKAGAVIVPFRQGAG